MAALFFNLSAFLLALFTTLVGNSVVD